MSAYVVDDISIALQTVGIGTTAIITYPIPDNSCFEFDVDVVGQSGAGLFQISRSIQNGVKRWSAGSAAFTQSSPKAFTTDTDASFGASDIPTITVSGNNLIINVVQSQGGTYNWRARLQVKLGFTP